MIRIVLTSVIVLFLVACKESSPTASRQTTSSGIEYTLIQMPDHENVSIQVAWPSDWAYREDLNQAAPYVGTQLILAGGAEGFPAGDVGERFADLNSHGSLGLITVDNILGELNFEKGNMTETVEIANAHLRAPSLDEIWFGRIRDGIAQNMAEAQSQPAIRGYNAVWWAVFGDQPLRNALSLDEPGTFENLTRNDVIAWYDETITREPSAIVIAGTLTAKEAGVAIDALFDNLPDSDRDIRRDVTPDFTPRRILLHMPDTETTNLAFFAPLPPSRHGQEFEDMIITHALGGDDQSVLFEAMRTGLRASYEFGASIDNYTHEHRIFFMNGEVEGDKLTEAEHVVREAYMGFLENGPSGSLADRKVHFEAYFSTLAEFVADQARYELLSILDGFAQGRSLALSKDLSAVSEASVDTRLAEAFPTADNFIVIAVSPDTSALPGACVITSPREATDC